MKAVLQRVTRASVTVDGEVISSIGRGLLVLIGIDKNDTKSDSDILVKKILSAKLFEDPGEAWGSWKRSVKDIDGEVLCVSQFTLMAQFKGSKPDFHDAMPSTLSRDFYYTFLDDMKRAHHPSKIQDGKFGGMMDVALLNDGPLTIILSSLDSRNGKLKSRDTTPAISGVSTPVSFAEPGEDAGKGAAKGKPGKPGGSDMPEAWKAKVKAKAERRAAGEDGQEAQGKKGKGKSQGKGKGNGSPDAPADSARADPAPAGAAEQNGTRVEQRVGGETGGTTDAEAQVADLRGHFDKVIVSDKQ